MVKQLPMDIVRTIDGDMESAIANLGAALVNDRPEGVWTGIDRIDMLGSMFCGFAKGCRDILEMDAARQEAR